MYAEGVVNPPNDSEIFRFYFNLGHSVTSEDQAQNIVDALNHIISNPASFTGDQPFLIQRHINGLVHGGGIPKEFENSPQVYVIPEPVTLS